MKIFISLFLLLPSLTFANAYVCRFDYFGKISAGPTMDKVSDRYLAILPQDTCTDTNKTIFKKEIDELNIEVSCQKQAQLKVFYKTRILLDKVIDHKDFDRPFMYFLLSPKLHGLRINCSAHEILE